MWASPQRISPRKGGSKPGHKPQKRRFSAAAWAEKAQELPRLDPEGDVFQHRQGVAFKMEGMGYAAEIQRSCRGLRGILAGESRYHFTSSF